MVSAIQTPAPISQSWRLKNPFVQVSRSGTVAKAPEAPVVKQEEPLALTSVVLGRALINGAWYKEGDTLRGYTIQHVEPELVVLKKGKTFRPLTVPKEGKGNIVIERVEQ